MKVSLKGLVAAAYLLSLPVSYSMAHASGKWSCMKDGKETKVKGKSADDKKKSCEAAGGAWAEHK